MENWSKMRDTRLHAAREIEALIAPPLEKEKVPTINLYRAVYGTGSLINNNFVFAGATLEELRASGIFTSNKSVAQYNSFLGGGRDKDFVYRRVNGLPVHARPEEALQWLGGKKFTNKPAIVVVSLPIAILSGEEREVVLIKNTLSSETRDKELGESDLLAHIDGTGLIQGECYLRGVNDSSSTVPLSIRNFENILVPKELKDNSEVNFEAGFEIVS